MEREPHTPRERAILLLRAALVPGWHPTAGQSLVWVTRSAIILGVLLLIASAVDKTLWDWLELLIIPAVIAGGTIWFNQAQQVRQQEQQRSLAALEERRARHNEIVNALQGEKESVAYVAFQVREEGLPDDKERRAQLLTALYLAILFQHADRTRALVFSALRDSYHKEHGEEVMETLRRLKRDFTRYKNDLGAAQQKLAVEKEKRFNISSMDKHIERLKVLEEALLKQEERGLVSQDIEEYAIGRKG